MTTDTISPLRRRMIEDMNSRNLGARMHRGHIYENLIALPARSIGPRRLGQVR
jgi:hypothetical protein